MAWSVAQIPVVCEFEDCDRPLPAYSGKGRPPKYHPECKVVLDKRRWRAKYQPPKAKLSKPVNREFSDSKGDADGRSQFRRPPDEFIEDRWAERISDEGWSRKDAAEYFGVDPSTITRWIAYVAKQARTEARRSRWKPPPEAEASLYDLAAFRERYFRTAEGEKYITADCHVRWIDVLERAVQEGTRQAIVAPPRHGKSEALVHKVIQLIIRNPNIRILWIGGNEEIAEVSTRLVMNELEGNERLIADFCGPGGSFKPAARTGAKWTTKELTVATRTRAIAGSTLKAVGQGGKILSRTADVLICDDLEDDQSTAQPKGRADTVRWFTKDVASRKTAKTAWFYIGSRQHPEDLISYLLGNPKWDVIVEQAHDDACDKPEQPFDAHVDCVLAPELRSFEFLMDQKHSMPIETFEMQFLNRPRSDGLTIFPRDVVEACRDYSRSLGEVPSGTRLIAGLDPASSGYQAAVLWAVHVESNTRFLVDVENIKGGGVVHMRSILERWTHKYPGLVEWVIEQNIVEDTLAHDTPLRELKQRLGFRFVPHKTGRNKWDLRMGVKGLVPAFEDRRIVLPYGDVESRAKVEPLINQFVNFTDNATSHQTSYKTDIVMAAWFPEATIQGWQREQMFGMSVERSGGGLGGLESFDGLLGGL